MKLRNLLTAVLAMVFVASSAMALGLAADYEAGNESYDSARALMSGSQQENPFEPMAAEILPLNPDVRSVSEPDLEYPKAMVLPQVQADILSVPEKTVPIKEEPSRIIDGYAAQLSGVDLEALQAVNPQVIGWIFIPGTNIDYPIVQGEDNQYYLEHTWDGQDSKVGAVFMESTDAPDFSDYSTILYAHNLRSGTMFSALHSYKEQVFWEENPYVYIVTDLGMFRYAIYAAYEADVTGTTYWRDVDSELRRQEYVDYGLANSILDTGIVPTTDTPVLTLSTCTGYTYARRWVVQAVLEGPIAAPEQ